MHDLAIILRSAQLYAHNAHNMTKGKTFFSDHKFFGQLYPVYEEAYDSIVERMIGLGYDVSIYIYLSIYSLRKGRLIDGCGNTSFKQEKGRKEE